MHPLVVVESIEENKMLLLISRNPLCLVEITIIMQDILLLTDF